MNQVPRYVLDTHAALWAQLEPRRLGPSARAALSGLAPAAVAISDVTLTETARLLRDGKIVPGTATPATWLEALGRCYTILPITPQIAWAAAAFAWSHRDPCDRQILATAQVHGLPLLSLDPKLGAFAPSIGVKIVW